MPPIADAKSRFTGEYSFKPVERLTLARFMLTSPVVFPAGTAGQLGGNPSASVSSEPDEGQPRQWCTLLGWLEAEPKPVMTCLRSGGFNVQLKSRGGAALLLPFSSPPSASFTWKQAGQTEKRPFEVLLDEKQGALKLRMSFGNDDAGHKLYGEIVTALQSAASHAAAEIAFTHSLHERAPQEPAQPPTHPLPAEAIFIRPDIIFGPGRRVGERVERTGQPVFSPKHMGGVADATRVPFAAVEPAVAHVARPAAAELRVAAVREPLVVEESLLAARMSPFVRLRTQPQLIPPGTPGVEVKNVALAAPPVSLTPLQSQWDSVFPDLKLQERQGWDQLDRQGRALMFRDSAQLDTFHYLPAQFKLGFCRGEADSVRHPLHAELYLDEAGLSRARVTLVALPFMEDQDREALRTYLRDVLLKGFSPYVRLFPAVGLEARFEAAIQSAVAGEARPLPASLRFKAAETIPDQRLVLEFDMRAEDYPLFCTLLRNGLQGQVTLKAEGFQHSVPVRLRLDDITSNVVDVRLDGTTLAIENGLDLPVRLGASRVGLLELGPTPVPGVIWDLEEHEVIPAAGRSFAAREVLSAPLALERIDGWDETVVCLGRVQVDGLSPEEWLNRAERDASLQEHSFGVRLRPTSPPGSDRIQLVQVRLLRDGEAAPRQRVDLTPGGTHDLTVPLTLAELRADGSAGSPFYLEYDCLYGDGKLSLPQRIALNPGLQELPLAVLLESPASVFTVEYTDPATGTQRVEGDRAAARRLIDELRGKGGRWRVYARQAEAPATGQPGATPPTGTPAPTATGPAVTIVTELLAERLRTGLRQAFVVLQATGPGAPTSTFVFDAQNAVGQSWRPAGGAIPPFKYRITYLYETGGFRQIDGTEAGLTLVLDPPPAAG